MSDKQKQLARFFVRVKKMKPKLANKLAKQFVKQN